MPTFTDSSDGIWLLSALTAVRFAIRLTTVSGKVMSGARRRISLDPVGSLVDQIPDPRLPKLPIW